MEVKILKEDKKEMDIEVDNLTIVELLRVYLNRDSAVSFAAWKKNTSTKKPIISVKTSGKTAKKAVSDAISATTKDLDVLLSDFKKLK